MIKLNRLAFFVILCMGFGLFSCDMEEVQGEKNGDISFFAGDDVGKNKGIINILIVDKNRDDVAMGTLRESSTGDGVSCQTPSRDDVWSTSLNPGKYYVYAFEGGDDGGEFNRDTDGELIEIIEESCLRIELGVTSGFDNARIAVRKWGIKSVTPM